MCPIDTYINTAKNPTDHISLFLRSGVSLSLSTSSSFSSFFAFASLRTALYPAFSTAASTTEGDTSPSTIIDEVRRFTEHDDTPSSADTDRSTFEEHAAQLIPRTVYWRFIYPPPINYLLKHFMIRSFQDNV